VEQHQTQDDLNFTVLVFGELFAMSFNSPCKVLMWFVESLDTLELNDISLKDEELVRFGLNPSTVEVTRHQLTGVHLLLGENQSVGIALTLV
jgi:hypothetical protein